MQENYYIDVLFDDFMAGNIDDQPHGATVVKAARALQAAIRSGADFSEDIADLEYISARNGFYAGFLAAQGLFTA